MTVEKNSEAAENAAFTKAPIPPGTKRVRKTEIYNEPIKFELGEPESTKVEGVQVGICPQCGDPVLNTEDLKQTAEGIAHADCVDDAEEPPPRPISAADLFLSSLKDEGDRGADVKIYIRRKPDPASASFRNPYSGPEKAVGVLEYDDTLDSQAAVDMAVQRLHHGGYYYFEVRRSGQYHHSWSRFIDDPAIHEKPAAADPVAAPGATAPAPISDNFQVFKRQAVEFAEVAKAFGLAPRSARAEESTITAQPAPDPLSSITTSVALVKSVMDLAKDMNPGGGAAGGERERTNMDSVLEVSRELGLGDVAREFLKPLAAVGGAILADSLAQMRYRKAEESRRAMAGNASPPGETAQVPAPNVGAPTPKAIVEPPPAAPVPAAMFDEQTKEFLRPMVDDMVKGNDGGVDRAASSTLAMIQLQKMMGVDALPYVQNEIISKSGFELLIWLGDGNPEWKYLRSSREAADYVAFLDDFCETVQDELQGEPEGADDVSRETSDDESPEILNEIAETAMDSEQAEDVTQAPVIVDAANVGAPTAKASPQESGPPAAVGGQKSTAKSRAKK